MAMNESVTNRIDIRVPFDHQQEYQTIKNLVDHFSEFFLCYQYLLWVVKILNVEILTTHRELIHYIIYMTIKAAPKLGITRKKSMFWHYI